MKVYCVKYALTKGISEHSVISPPEKGNVIVSMPGALNGQMLLSRGEWAYTIGNAIRMCEVKRDRKVYTLQRQIEKLVAIDFIECLVNENPLQSSAS